MRKRHPLLILLRAKHDPEFAKLSDLEIVIRHRGAPEDKKLVSGGRIARVSRRGFWIEETFIPAHRILEVRRIKKNKKVSL
jgi:uncharacterized protein (UPF0248 family)